MKTVSVKIIGTTPLMHHKMDQETLFGLLGAKSRKKKDKEILTPRQIAKKHAYQDDAEKCYIPAEYIVGAFANVAGDYKQRNSSRKSIKSIAQGIFRPTKPSFYLLDKKGKQIKDFEIDVKKAVNHQKGAIAVCRPRFDDWQCHAEFLIDDELVSLEVVQQILEDAGRRSGIGSFRVSKGGYFGQFRIEEFKVIDK